MGASLERLDTGSIPGGHSGLRIRHCCSWDLISGLGTPYTEDWPKKKKKKKKPQNNAVTGVGLA